MKKPCRSILTATRIGTLLLLLTVNVSGQNSRFPATNTEAQALIEHLEYKTAPLTLWDTNGNLIKVSLSRPEATDTNLALLSTVQSINELHLQTHAHGSNSLSREGIFSLNRLTNLTTFVIACTFRMPDGMFEEICNLQHLRSLTLYGAYPPEKDQYENLKRLTNLEELKIIYCPAFEGRQLQVLTTLTRLKKLNLDVLDTSKSETNILRNLKNLTNLTIYVVKK